MLRGVLSNDKSASCGPDAPMPWKKMISPADDILLQPSGNEQRALDPSWGAPSSPAAANAQPSWSLQAVGKVVGGP